MKKIILAFTSVFKFMLKSKTILMNMVTSGLLAFNMTGVREVRKVFEQLE